MKEKNALNLFSLSPGYKWIYPSCWWENIKFEFRKFKWAWQRITKGYSDWDLWDLDIFFQRLFSYSIKEFAENTIGWPSGEEFPQFEDWQKYLFEMARLFKESIEGEESLKNEYWEEYWDKILAKPDFFNHINDEESEDEKAIRKKYFNQEIEIAKYRDDCANKAFDMMKHAFGHLWW